MTSHNNTASNNTNATIVPLAPVKKKKRKKKNNNKSHKSKIRDDLNRLRKSKAFRGLGDALDYLSD